MFYKNLLNILAVSSFILLGSCGHRNSDHHDDKLPIAEPHARSIDSFKLTSVADSSVDTFCDNISDFFSDYQKRYLPDVEFKPQAFSEKKKCGGGVDVGDSRILYKFTFDLLKGDQSIELSALVTLKFDSQSGLFTVLVDRITRDNEKVSEDLDSVLNSEKYLLPIYGDALLDLTKTFSAWAEIEKKDLLIFGKPYSEFLVALSDAFAADENKSSAITPTLKFKLEPSQSSKAKGKVSFVGVAQDYFKKSTDASSEDAGTFLNCKDLACLNTSGIVYSVSLNVITFRTPSVTTVEGALPVSNFKQFSIAISGFPGNL